MKRERFPLFSNYVCVNGTLSLRLHRLPLVVMATLSNEGC